MTLRVAPAMESAVMIVFFRLTGSWTNGKRGRSQHEVLTSNFSDPPRPTLAENHARPSAKAVHATDRPTTEHTLADALGRPSGLVGRGLLGFS